MLTAGVHLTYKGDINMRRRNVLLAGLVVLILSLTSLSIAYAQSFRTGNDATLQSNSTVDGSLYLAGTTVDVAGQVNGDVYCVGSNVTISGTINGDVLCAAQNINIIGTVSGSVRVIAQNVTIASSIGRNLNVAAQQVSLTSNGKIGGDATIAATNTTLNGSITRDMVVAGSTITINDMIGRNVNAAAGQLQFGSNAVVKGNVSYKSNNEAIVSSGAKVNGTITRTSSLRNTTGRSGVNFYGVAFAWSLFMVFGFVMFSLVTVLLFPEMLYVTAERTTKYPWKTLLIGLLAAIALPILSFVLAISILGIPLSIAVVLIWILLAMFSGPFVAFYIGRMLLKNTNNALLIMLVGVLAVSVLYIIPIVGWVVSIFSYLGGLGILLLELHSHYHKPHYTIKPVKAMKE